MSVGDERREALEAAFDAVAAKEGPQESAPEPDASPAPDASESVADVASNSEQTAPTRDGKGRFATKKEEDASGVKTPTPPAKATAAAPPAAAGVQSKDAAPPVESPAPGLKAPRAWKALVREKWAALPSEVQQEVLRRESEAARGMQEAAEEKKFAKAVRDTIAPFEGMIRAEGHEPLSAVRDLLQMAHALRTAPPQHKAQLIGHLIQTFGVDIKSLDDYLAGAGQPNGAAPATTQAYRDPRLDSLIAEIEQAKAARAQSEATRAQAEVAAFHEKHEFFEDVRESMQKLLRAGIASGLEDAYNQALKLHPELSEVLQQRKAAEAAKAVQASTQRALMAASSVKSRPSGSTPASTKPGTLRDDLDAAWDAASSR